MERRQASWQNYRAWVAMSLNVFLAPDGLVATDETIDQFAQILECRAKELAAGMVDEIRTHPARFTPSDEGKVRGSAEKDLHNE